MAWHNADTLYVRFGTEEALGGRAGEYNMTGSRHMVELAIDLTELSSSAQTILSDTVTIPNGAHIEQIDVLVTEVTAGTNANLDLGLIDQDRSTELDYNGFLAAADAWHTSAKGTLTEYVTGTTEAGALVGTVLTNTGLIVAKADTAAFTNGTLTIRIYWSMVIADAD